MVPKIPQKTKQNKNFPKGYRSNRNDDNNPVSTLLSLMLDIVVSTLYELCHVMSCDNLVVFYFDDAGDGTQGLMLPDKHSTIQLHPQLAFGFPICDLIFFSSAALNPKA